MAGGGAKESTVGGVELPSWPLRCGALQGEQNTEESAARILLEHLWA